MIVIKDQMFHKKKVLFADLDGTIIETISGNTFPSGIWDMKLKFDVLDAIKSYGFECLIIVTNQDGIESGYVNERHFVKGKMTYLMFALEEYLGIPVEYAHCVSNDKNNEFRKPNIGMLQNSCYKFLPRWNIFASKDEMMLIGDASGEPIGWSDTDFQTAVNFDIDYMDVNDFVSRIKEAEKHGKDL